MSFEENKSISKNSFDEKNRLSYESREATLLDERSRIFDAIEETALTIATNLLDILDDKTIASKTGIDIDEVKKLRLSNENKY
jgi:3-deoxy-D-manno-octulosonic acid (KDO) 8-phosphate synthase